MQISRILKLEPMPGTPTKADPDVGGVVPHSKHKEEDSIKLLSQHGLWTSDIISDDPDLSF
jgi:hypothetical protein